MIGSTSSIISKQDDFKLSTEYNFLISEERKQLNKLDEEHWLITKLRMGDNIFYIKSICLLPNNLIRLFYRSGESENLPLSCLSVSVDKIHFEYEITEITADSCAFFFDPKDDIRDYIN